jgi:hypothetical protein
VRVVPAGDAFAQLKTVRVRFDGSSMERTLDEGATELAVDGLSSSTRTVRIEIEETFAPPRRIALSEVEVEGAGETR